MNISNELISEVLGCDCEIITVTCCNIIFKTNLGKDVDGSYKRPKKFYLIIERLSASPNLLLNIDTFNRLSKIWAFKKGYEINIDPNTIEVFTWLKQLNSQKYNCVYATSLDENNYFSQERIIECLEWIQKEVSK